MRSGSRQTNLGEIDRKVTKRRGGLPCAAGEVGHVHRGAAPSYGLLAQFAQAAPAREVVDVLVERQAVLQAVREPEHHEEVHAAVAAEPLGHLAGLLPERVHELLFHLLGALRLEERVDAGAGLLLPADAVGIVGEDALRAGHGVDARIRARRAHVVLDHDRAAPLRLNEHRVHVAHLDLVLRPPGAGIRGLRVRLEVELVGLERDEVVEAVAAVDVHVPADGAEAVRRVLVALVRRVVPEAPEVPVRVDALLLVVAGRLLNPLAVVVAPEVVYVRALGMDEVAELAEPAEVQGEHLVLAVAAVLELHAVALEPFGGLDELPAVVDGERRGHLRRDVLSGAHRVERDGHVQLPRGRVVDEIDVGVVAKPLPGLLRTGIDLGLRPARRRDLLLDPPDARGVDVADGGNLAAGDGVEAMYACKAPAEANDAHAQLLEGLVGVERHLAAFAKAEALCGRAADKRGRRAHPRRALQELTSVHLRGPPLKDNLTFRRARAASHGRGSLRTCARGDGSP